MSDQRPESWGVMRPFGNTEVASMIVREAPRQANAPRLPIEYVSGVWWGKWGGDSTARGGNQ